MNYSLLPEIMALWKKHNPLMSEAETPIIIQPTAEHTATVIWLHGLGADGSDFAPIVPELKLPVKNGTRFIFPHAPRRSITINGGMVMRGWYDVRAMDLTVNEDAAGIESSAALLAELLDRETRQLDSDRVILAGFSQGGAMALHTGLRYRQRLAGLMALSAYLPLSDRLAEADGGSNRATPILMMHGVYDPVIPVRTAEQSCALLRAREYQVEWRQYAMQHAVCPQQIDDISQWMSQVLSA